MLGRTTGVDAVGLEERAAGLAKRSIKKAAKLWALDLAIRCIDLTTLEGADTPGKVVAMCSKAVRPDPTDPSIPSVGAVCIYPALVGVAATAARACMSRASPARSRRPRPARAGSTRSAAPSTLGADEIDIVLNRSAFLAGRYRQAFEEIVASKDACGAAHLQGDPGDRRARVVRPGAPGVVLAMAAGADFIKTSTGKIGTARRCRTRCA